MWEIHTSLNAGLKKKKEKEKLAVVPASVPDTQPQSLPGHIVKVAVELLEPLQTVDEKVNCLPGGPLSHMLQRRSSVFPEPFSI